MKTITSTAAWVSIEVALIVFARWGWIPHWWVYVAPVVTFIFGSVVCLAIIANAGHYERLRSELKIREEIEKLKNRRRW